MLISKYTELYNIIGTKYGGNLEETEFNLPDLRNKFIEGANIELDELNTLKDPGIPELYGDLGATLNAKAEQGGTTARTGVFKESAVGTRWYAGTGDACRGGNARFKASGGERKMDGTYRNDVYGKSDTVQPSSVCVNYIIKVIY